MVPKSTGKSTRQLLRKVPNHTGLYRHEESETYYGIKRIAGKRKERSLKTTDRKLAERRLKDWIDRLQFVDTEVEKMTMGQLIEKFVAASKGKAKKTRDTDSSIIITFKKTWPLGMHGKVGDVRPSHLSEWLAKHEGRLRHTTYNRYAGFLKQLFQIAVSDRIIAKSPFADVKTPWKRPQAPIRRRPTPEQLSDIIEEVRAQQFAPDPEESADFISFLATAALGQAEVSALTWADVGPERIKVKRRKTGAHFEVPIYPELRAVVERLRARKPSHGQRDRLFHIQEARKALAGACRRLKYPAFTQRSLRQYGIVRLIRAGIPIKLVAQWQGHRDGGKLIMDTYSEVISDDQQEYETLQLKKLEV